MLAMPNVGEFTWHVSNMDGVRPSASPGTSITPLQNTYGSYTEVLGDLAFDAWGIHIVVSSNAASANARDTLLTIGIDTSGGTSYVTHIPDLLVSNASSQSTGGIHYYFPIHIPAGSSVAAKASMNNASPTAFPVWVTVYGKPRNPQNVKKGQFVRAFGINSGTSSGTSITPGTASDGTWTLIGSSNSTDIFWHWQIGFGFNNADQTGYTYFAEFSENDASNQRIIGPTIVWTGSSERCTKPLSTFEYVAKSSSTFFARMRASGGPDTGVSLALYGVGR